MRPDELTLSKHRLWLEEHIGEQKINWEWRIRSAVDNTLEIDFYEFEHALLFELSWPT